MLSIFSENSIFKIKYTHSDLGGGPNIGLDERVNCTSQGHSIKFRIIFILSVYQISLEEKIL